MNWRHRWLWELRLLQARAEIALARQEWEAAPAWSAQSLTESQLRGRAKYRVAGLVTRAQALAGLGRKSEALAGLDRALAVARPVGDPALILRAGLARTALEPNEPVFLEAKETARKILSELPDEMRPRFRSAAWTATLAVAPRRVPS